MKRLSRNDEVALDVAPSRSLRQTADVLEASPTTSDCVTTLVPSPRIWPSPPGQEYVDIKESQELVEYVNNAPIPLRFVRLPAGPQLLDIGDQHLMPPPGTKTVIDCQGSIVASSSRNRPPPTRDSFLGVFNIHWTTLACPTTLQPAPPCIACLVPPVLRCLAALPASPGPV